MNIFHEIINADYTIAKRNSFGLVSHWHQRFEFVYIASGEYEFVISKKSYIGRAGDLFAIHSGEIHEFREKDEKSLAVVCTFNPSVLHHLHAELQQVQSHISALELSRAGIQQEVEKIFDEMLTESRGEKKWGNILIQTDIIRLYSLLVRYFEKAASLSRKDVGKFQTFQIALSYIAEHYAESITLKNVAEKINYNPSYVSTLFVTYTGVNFKSYLDNIRINHAIELIRSTGQTFTEISANCGYDSIRTFNHVFKKITGLSPGQLKNIEI